MAYCKQCGAYIPDGLSACLACGYDEAAEQQRGAAAERDENEDYRLKYEEERRRRQEDNRKWAEREKARREAEEARREEQFRRQEEYRREAEQERLRREAETEERRRAEQEARARTAVYRSVGRSGEKNRVLAALSYLSVLFILPRIFCEDDAFARYHARQGLTLFIFGVLCDALSAVLPVGWLISLFRLYCIYKGMTNALNDRTEPLPIIGQYGEKRD